MVWRFFVVAGRMIANLPQLVDPAERRTRLTRFRATGTLQKLIAKINTRGNVNAGNR
jgi:hypothetical protein